MPRKALFDALARGAGSATARCVGAFALATASGSALAQTAPTPPPDAPPVVETAPALTYLSRRTETQRLATSFIGKNVFGPNGEKIGDINDIVVDIRASAATAVVIGVGGFLGLGEKDVAVPLGVLRVERVEGAPRLVIGVTREDLRKAPPFDRGDPRL